MTNTLHRFGSAESFRDDYVVFAIASKGRNEEGALEKLRRFLQIAVEFRPVNLGDAIHGGALRPSKQMNPGAHWRRDVAPDFESVIAGLDSTTTVAAVFDNRVAAEDFVKAVKAAELGLEGATGKLPESNVLMLSTMCGHGMVSHGLAKKMIDWVKEGRRTPEQAAGYMTRFCSCGVFNPVRAARVLEQAARGENA
jgi:hypothetical protein